MQKKELLEYINSYIETIKISPELFHDGIDEEILDLLYTVKKYIAK